MILAEWTRFEVLKKRSDRASPSLKLPGGHWKSPSLRDGPLNNLFKSVILTTNEIKLCSDLLASFGYEIRQALQICRGAYGPFNQDFGAKQLLSKTLRSKEADIRRRDRNHKRSRKSPINGPAHRLSPTTPSADMRRRWRRALDDCRLIREE